MSRNGVNVARLLPMTPDMRHITIDARRFAVAALADELAEDPALLRAYGGTFGAADEVTLVIYTSGSEDPAAQLGPVVAAAGLDGPDSPDLLAVPGGPDAAAAIAQRAGALYSRRAARGAFAALPRFDDEMLGELRRIAVLAPAPAPGAGVMVGDELLEVPADMRWAFVSGSWCEEATTLWFDRLLTAHPRPVVYDVGGNCGWFALRAARSGAQVRAFEPMPTTADVLERNLRRHAHARVIRAAVGDAAGSASMHVYSSCGNNSLVERTLPPGHPLRHEGMIEVEVVRLDDLVGTEGFPPPTLVKIDVEGYELAVLRGARATLQRERPALVLEWSETTSRDAGHGRFALVDELRALGYEPVGVQPDGSVVAPEHADEHVDTLVAAQPGVPRAPENANDPGDALVAAHPDVPRAGAA